MPDWLIMTIFIGLCVASGLVGGIYFAYTAARGECDAQRKDGYNAGYMAGFSTGRRVELLGILDRTPPGHPVSRDYIQHRFHSAGG